MRCVVTMAVLVGLLLGWAGLGSSVVVEATYGGEHCWRVQGTDDTLKFRVTKYTYPDVVQPLDFNLLWIGTDGDDEAYSLTGSGRAFINYSSEPPLLSMPAVVLRNVFPDAFGGHPNIQFSAALSDVNVLTGVVTLHGEGKLDSSGLPVFDPYETAGLLVPVTCAEHGQPTNPTGRLVGIP